MDCTLARSSGILLHPTSLPSPYGIGDLGKECHAFVSLLAEAGIGLWQLLPLGPTGYGNSPYSARSSFAGNEFLISPELLADEGLLETQELDSHPPFTQGKVDYQMVESWKIPLLKKAAVRFLQGTGNDAFTVFCRQNASWLEDYALFMVLYEKYHDARWHTLWDKDVAWREGKALQKVRDENEKEILIWKALQFFWENQWQSVRKQANGLGIRIIGDIPIFVASDSADTWSDIGLFQTDKNGRYTRVSGVPPDCFCLHGQLWGNPLYDWDAMRKDGFSWWMSRIRRQSHLTDIIRIDHFRGFAAYYAIPSDAKNADHGVWEKAPGKEFFTKVKETFPHLDILAEDLGFMTEDVYRLRDEFGFPGMKIGQFGFHVDEKGKIDTKDSFLPHNYPYQSIAYTGTHDNETVQGWFSHQEGIVKRYVLDYLDTTEGNVPQSMIRSILMSNAKYAIFPLQDILSLGDEARMNTPSTCGDFNWSWQLSDKEKAKEGILSLGRLSKLYGR